MLQASSLVRGIDDGFYCSHGSPTATRSRGSAREPVRPRPPRFCWPPRPVRADSGVRARQSRKSRPAPVHTLSRAHTSVTVASTGRGNRYRGQRRGENLAHPAMTLGPRPSLFHVGTRRTRTPLRRTARRRGCRFVLRPGRPRRGVGARTAELIASTRGRSPGSPDVAVQFNVQECVRPDPDPWWARPTGVERWWSTAVGGPRTRPG